MAKTLHTYLRYLPLLIALLFSALQPVHASEKWHTDFEKAYVKSAEGKKFVRAWEDLLDEAVDPSVRKNIDALADSDAAIDAIQITGKRTWPEIRAFWKRGNDFNAKGRAKYTDDYVEIVLKGVNGKPGKQLDTYLPPSNENPSKIISRKATTLSEIQPNTFRSYLNELITKYSKNAELNSSKFPPGTRLDGDYKLEIPESNKSFFESSEEFQNVLNDFNTSKKVNIEIIYLVE